MGLKPASKAVGTEAAAATGHQSVALCRRSDAQRRDRGRVAPSKFPYAWLAGPPASMPRTGCIGWAASTDLWMKASCAYAAGAVGGVCNALMAILLQVVGINAALHVTWDALPYKPGWLYNKMVWGGFWAMLYLLPLRRPHWLVRGLLFGLIASTVHCAIGECAALRSSLPVLRSESN